MSKDSAIIPMCDIHHDDVAQALCHNHKKLLCLSCVLEKAKSAKCSFTEIRKVSGEKDSLLLECLSVRQIAKKKERLIEEHENKTEILKDKLKQEVTEMYGNLTKRLDKMKENCLTSIDKQAKTVTAANEHNKQRLATFQRTVNEHIEKLSAESVADKTDIQLKFEEVKTEVMNNIPDKDTTPEGLFTPNDRLSEVIMRSGASLGSVYLIAPERYDKIDESNSTHDGSSKPVYTSSDEVVHDTNKTKPDFVESDESNEAANSINVPEKKKSESNEGKGSTDISGKSGTTSADGKSKKKNVGIFNWFSTDKKKTYELDGQEKKTGSDKNDDQGKSANVKKRPSSESGTTVTENIYQESTFYTSTNEQPKYLINKTVKASSLKQLFTSACKFSKLVDLGDGYIGMFSEVHNSLVLVGTSGQVFGRKTFKEGNHAVAAVGNQELAVIAEPGLQVSKFKVNDKGFTAAASFVVNEEISNITGFDYDVASSKFAVSSPNKVIVLDKRGQTLNVVPFGTANTSARNELATTYEFINNCLYMLNTRDKTLKMFSLEKSDALWKRKFESSSVMPRSMCLYKDTLCIACGDAIALFAASSGKPIVKHDTEDLLDDCLGICVIDDVLVFSSNSDNIEKSTSLAYISM
ncbi:uncharacterized protein LOC123529345 isoform X2 [Mercenaria mercenaria]|nr:uncharacterized protein LOC123529345 isoform X2 [Mercenaria mercenaria]